METKCGVCRQELAKYKCPQCLLRSCSLGCVKLHKAENGCSGTRDKTAFVQMKNYTDAHLQSDYRFLEDASRKADSASRDLLKKRRDRPKFVTNLLRQCRLRGIQLTVMPFPLSKRKTNSTYFDFKMKKIFWRVMWLFPQAEAKYTDRKIDEETVLRDALIKYIHPSDSDPVIRQRLRVYAAPGLDNVRLFLKVEGRRVDDVRYHELDLDKSLKNNLGGKAVLEYPSIHVVLKYCCLEYAVLLKDKDCLAAEVKATKQSAAAVKDGEEVITVDSGSSDSESDSDSDSGSTSSSSEAHSPGGASQAASRTTETTMAPQEQSTQESGVCTRARDSHNGEPGSGLDVDSAVQVGIRIGEAESSDLKLLQQQLLKGLQEERNTQELKEQKLRAEILIARNEKYKEVPNDVNVKDENGVESAV